MQITLGTPQPNAISEELSGYKQGLDAARQTCVVSGWGMSSATCTTLLVNGKRLKNFPTVCSGKSAQSTGLIITNGGGRGHASEFQDEALDPYI